MLCCAVLSCLAVLCWVFCCLVLSSESIVEVTRMIGRKHREGTFMRCSMREDDPSLRFNNWIVPLPRSAHWDSLLPAFSSCTLTNSKSLAATSKSQVSSLLTTAFCTTFFSSGKASSVSPAGTGAACPTAIAPPPNENPPLFPPTCPEEEVVGVNDVLDEDCVDGAGVRFWIFST